MLLAPIASTYGSRVPYVTPEEFRRHPTGVDTKTLVPGGTAPENAQALRDILRRASSFADNITDKVLSATVDTVYKTCAPMGGVLKVALDDTPVIGIVSVEVNGSDPGNLDSASLEGRILTLPTSYTGKVPVKVTYINGWANAQLTSTALPGATSLQLNNALGVVPGMTLQLSGAAGAESVTVAPTFVPVTTLAEATVPLAAPITGSATGGYMVNDVATAMPQSIKLAVILLACSIIKTQGTSAMVMASVNSSPDHEVPFQDGATGEYGMAVDLLLPYRKVAVL